MSAKWPGLPAFLAHLAIGACLAMPVNTFVQYYFNGRLMAQLPQWDASIYSHAVIMPMDVLGVRFTALLCTTEPFTVSDDGYLELQKPTTAILATGVIANRVHVRWKWLEGTNDYDAGVWNTSVATVIWSNYDLVDAAGNVYLKASEPVPRAPIPVLPEPDPEPEPEPERKPIAYKYNGVQLPDINTVWTDKETDPCAYLTQSTSDMYLLITVAEVPTTEINKNGDPALFVPIGTKCRAWVVVTSQEMFDIVGQEFGLPGVNVWGEFAIYNMEEGDFLIGIQDSFWASNDILNTDGTVYLAASEPVPVYE